MMMRFRLSLNKKTHKVVPYAPVQGSGYIIKDLGTEFDKINCRKMVNRRNIILP